MNTLKLLFTRTLKKFRSFLVDQKVKRLINRNDEFYCRCSFVCGKIGETDARFYNCTIFRLNTKGNMVICTESDSSNEILTFPTVLLYFTERELDNLVEQQAPRKRDDTK